MRRLHLFEWEDQPWLPGTIRNFLTDQLRFAQGSAAAAAAQQLIGKQLKAAMERLNTDEAVDLCSGAGGPLPMVRKRLAEEDGFKVRLTLSDRFPNITAFRRIEQESGGTVQCRYDSVSVFDVPAELRGIRTLCTALHHFKPDDARRILQDAVDKGRGIAVFEPLDKSLRLFLIVTVGAFFLSFLTAPFVGRMTLARFVFTYIVPVCPLVMAWDGGVSVLRSYSVDALKELTADIGMDRYTWDIACVQVPTPIGGMPLTYLIGLPAAKP